MTVIAADGGNKTTNEGVGNWIGGTGRYQGVRGIQRDHVIVHQIQGQVTTHAAAVSRELSVRLHGLAW